VSGQLLRGRGSADRLRALRLLRTYHLPGGICDATPARVTMASVIIMMVVVVVVVADEEGRWSPTMRSKPAAHDFNHHRPPL
jgi:hypothetical protein